LKEGEDLPLKRAFFLAKSLPRRRGQFRIGWCGGRTAVVWDVAIAFGAWLG